MTTREFPTEVVLSLSTGVLLCDFGKMHEFAEYLAGEPIWAHQFAHKPFWDELKKAIYFQHPALASVTGDGVDQSNWEQFRNEQISLLGPSLAFASMPNMRTVAEAFTEPLKGKNVAVIAVDPEATA